MDLEEIHTADSIMDVSENDWIDFVYIWILKRCGLSIDNPHFKQKKQAELWYKRLTFAKDWKLFVITNQVFFKDKEACSPQKIISEWTYIRF